MLVELKPHVRSGKLTTNGTNTLRGETFHQVSSMLLFTPRVNNGYRRCRIYTIVLLVVSSRLHGCYSMRRITVLNLNNIRDIENDSKMNKKTIPTRIGFKNAKFYHYCLIILSILLILTFATEFKISSDNR